MSFEEKRDRIRCGVSHSEGLSGEAAPNPPMEGLSGAASSG